MQVHRIVRWIATLIVVVGGVLTGLLQSNVQRLAEDQGWDKLLLKWWPTMQMWVATAWFWPVVYFAAGVASAFWLLKLFSGPRPAGLSVVYDRSIPSCDAVCTFGDNTIARCIRLQVTNERTTQLVGCQAWVKILEFKNISPFPVFWIGTPGASGGISMSADLVKDIPRFVQLFRIHESGAIIPATESEVWPIDSMDAFKNGNTYHFQIAFKGHDRAETQKYEIVIDWTGNMHTTTVRTIAK
jgi:hypothetical protein